MSEVPKKIYWDVWGRIADENQDDESEIPYIRADLVDELVETLEMCVKHLDADGNLWSKEEQAMALAALKALEVSNGN